MKKTNRWLAALSVAGVMLGGCSSNGGSNGDEEGSEGTAQGHGESTDSVTYLTSFNTFGRDAYVYVAQEKGYFEEAGLDVTIQPGSGSVDVMRLVASGSADFGTADFSAVVVTVANEDLPVVAVSAIHQTSLAAIITLEGNGIEVPADLEGKTIADQPGSTNQVIFPTYAELAGFDADQVEFVPSSPPSLPQLLVSDQVDAIGQFVVGKPLIEGVAPDTNAVVLPYGDVVPELYGNVLLASEDLVDSDPELVARFNAALLRGLEYSIENPEETGEILKKYQPTQDADTAAAEVEIMADYVTGDREIGDLDRERVDAVIEIMSDALDSPVSADDLVMFDLETSDTP